MQFLQYFMCQKGGGSLRHLSPARYTTVCLLRIACVHGLLYNNWSSSRVEFLLSQILEEEVRAYDSNVEELSQEANKLIGDGHFDCSNITARQVSMYSQLP